MSLPLGRNEAMQVVTGAEMQLIEKEAFTKLGLSPLVVMENAGSRIVEVLTREYGSLSGKRVHILVGTGTMAETAWSPPGSCLPLAHAQRSTWWATSKN